MVDVVAIGACTPLGEGAAGWSVGQVGAPARVAIARDEALAAAGSSKPYVARVKRSGRDEQDPATALLLTALAPLEAMLRGRRIGVALGTSSGAMTSAERLFASLDAAPSPPPRSIDLAAATYHAPHRALLARLRAIDVTVARHTHVLTACSASTLALGLAQRWIDAGVCDVVIAGGYDALTTFVAAGFEALGATTASPPPRPFRLGRDGMCLGEGAALFVLARDARTFDATPMAHLLGFGASGDGVHLTAPDREGRGLARAASRALEDAAVDPRAIDLVSLHGTATPFNDAMESKAIVASLGARPVAIHAAKASIGHTLGAAGAIETAMLIDALQRQVAPASAGEGELDSALFHAPLARNESRRLDVALKLSAAFGGANAALVVARAGSVLARAPRRSSVGAAEAIEVVATAEVDGAFDAARIAEITGLPRDRLARMDDVCRAALAAVARLADVVGRDRLRGAGVVLSSIVATIEVNALYDRSLRARGASHAEGRRFAYTTPNAAAGECAIAFSLTGPNLAVGRGIDAAEEGEEVARDLLRAGDADRIVVIDVDVDGALAAAIAGALGAGLRRGARARLLAVG